MSATPSDRPEPRDSRIGTTLNERYRIVRRVGVGGMGIVYEGLHLIIQRRVAIKMLHVHYSTHTEILARFRREAIAATTIRHPHIVEVLDMGEAPDGAAYMVLEFLEGRDWSEDIERTGPQPLGKVARILREVCEGLQAAHDKGIVHRDLKPENVFLAKHGSRDDFVKIVDFGISKMSDSPDGKPGDDRKLTKTGAAMGTPYAMAPEQMKGDKDVDHRADVWSLGIILYRALTGAYPFDADTFPLLAVKVLTGDPAPLSNYRTDLPPAIQSIITRLLDKERSTRFQSAREVREALAAFETFDSAPATTGVAAFAIAATITPATPAPAMQAPAQPTRVGSHDGASPSPTAVTPATPATAIGHASVRGSNASTPPASPAAGSSTRVIGEAVRVTPVSLDAVAPPPRQASGVWTGAMLAVVLLAVGGGATIFGLRMLGPDTPPPTTIAALPPSSAPPATGPTVRLQISTTPPTAELTLDGVGIPNPFDADMPSGSASHTIVAHAPGHADGTREVSFAFPMRIAIELEPTAASTTHTSAPHDPPHTHAAPHESSVAPLPPSSVVAPPPPPPPSSAPPPETTTPPSTGRHGHGLSDPFAHP
jgi:serine/threonine-protein kinase